MKVKGNGAFEEVKKTSQEYKHAEILKSATSSK